MLDFNFSNIKQPL